ncbi:hypothetical protein PICMEDRAFT_14487 [Pichia membranifaciens NRRL Y-2026]|uniref:Damage-regulated import facilitator 1 n=1 Tax=Pichia membranifaciens NRRL Y-2026 TaxID=763406 RepID=A0A1E3NSA7_9ASCO|nr:hypothetical protein PICMEDRAFT_14487 [Pichia membranifaciens NRRL Y-2026]ODQ48981.1 hypothetical protein PICMEDRAFT_14487 [Pichia membranifaciens NRRL Y-2026]
MQVYKRHQRSGFEQQQQQQQSAAPQDATSERLQTLGMRIRQSISNGYKLPEANTSNNAAYINDYEQQQLQNNSRRVPLPAHLGMNGPPALDYNGSTASSLSCWEEELNHSSVNRSQMLNDFYPAQGNPGGVKRGIEELNDKEMQVNDYVQRYGPLSFNEEF